MIGLMHSMCSERLEVMEQISMCWVDKWIAEFEVVGHSNCVLGVLVCLGIV